jgi:hypothetical protein
MKCTQLGGFESSVDALCQILRKELHFKLGSLVEPRFDLRPDLFKGIGLRPPGPLLFRIRRGTSADLARL